MGRTVRRVITQKVARGGPRPSTSSHWSASALNSARWEEGVGRTMKSSLQFPRSKRQQGSSGLGSRLKEPRRAIGHAVAQMLRSTLAAVRLHSTRVLGCCAPRWHDRGSAP